MIEYIFDLNSKEYLCRDELDRMFNSKDKDLDGRLSFEEFMGEQSRAERLFKLMDKDGDGFVTKNVSMYSNEKHKFGLYSENNVISISAGSGGHQLVYVAAKAALL